MADTVTELNPGSGGDKMDEESAVQADSETIAKRPRVQLGYTDGDERQRLVSPEFPLPTTDRKVIELLTELLAETKEVKLLLMSLADNN